MRGSTSLIAALSYCLVTASALPHIELRPRAGATDSATKPSYSVVPLEPGNDNSGSGGGGGGGGDGGNNSPPSGDNGNDGNKDGSSSTTTSKLPEPVTVTETETETETETIVQTQDPVTRFVTVAQDPQTVTHVIPTTVISIVDATGVETTVTVTQTPSISTVPSSSVELPLPSGYTTSLAATSVEIVSKTVTVIGGLPPSNQTDIPAATSIPHSSKSSGPSLYSSLSSIYPSQSSIVVGTPTIVASPSSIITKAPTTQSAATMMQTPCTESSSLSSTRTYDNGLWHTSYPPWNAIKSPAASLKM